MGTHLCALYGEIQQQVDNNRENEASDYGAGDGIEWIHLVPLFLDFDIETCLRRIEPVW